MKKQNDIEKVNVVLKTTNYEMFKFAKNNRNVVFRKELLEEAKQGFIAPIIVDGTYTVIDGQNRLFHAAKANVPIKYMVDTTLTNDDIVRMNTTQKKWNVDDYVQSFANSGNEEYAKLVELQNEFSYSMTTVAAIGMLRTTGGSTSSTVKDGKFKFTNYDLSKRILRISQDLKNELGVKNNKMPYALLFLMNIEGFDFGRLFEKIRQVGDINKLNNANNKMLIMELGSIYDHATKSNGIVKPLEIIEDRKGNLIALGGK